MGDSPGKIRSKNRGDKWLFMFIACMVTAINMGLLFSFGSLFVTLMDTFQTDVSTAAVVQSLLVGVTFSFGVLSGILISRIGLTLVTLISSILVTSGFCMSYFAASIYFLYVSIGVVSAIGISMAFISSLTIARQAFTGTQSLMFISLVNTSVSLGAIIYPFFLEWLRELYGLLGTFLILGGITCNTFALFVMCLVHNIKVAVSKTGSTGDTVINDASRKSSKAQRKVVQYIEDLISVPYVCLLFATAFSFAALNGYIALILDIFMWKGFSDSQGLTAIVVFHIFGVISRLFPGVLKYKTNISVFVCAIISATSGCIGQLMLYVTSGYVPCIIGTCLSGIAIGGILSSSLVLIMEIVHLEKSPIAYGLLYTVNGLLSTVTGYILGKFKDTFDSYSSTILTICGSLLVADILYFIAFTSWKRRTSILTMSYSKEVDLLSPTNLENEQTLKKSNTYGTTHTLEC